MPEVAHHADRFLDVGDCLVIGECPFTADSQHGRPYANSKAMDAEVPCGEQRLFDGAPGSGPGLTAVVEAGAGSEAGGQNPTGRKLLPIEVDSHLHLSRQLRVNQRISAVDFDILRQYRAVELWGMTET